MRSGDRGAVASSASTPQVCPSCASSNLPTASRCDCGFVFGESQSASAPMRMAAAVSQMVTVTNTAKKCPRCGLYSPASALRCDCDYMFGAQAAFDPSQHGSVNPSGDTSRPESGRWNWVWPKVDTPARAALATKQAFWAAILCAAITFGFASLAAVGIGAVQGLGFDAGAMVDGALFGAIALGLWRQSRLAAWAGLALYCVERVYMWTTVGTTNPVIGVVFILAFIGGVRGTSALHRFRTTSVEQPASSGT